MGEEEKIFISRKQLLGVRPAKLKDAFGIEIGKLGFFSSLRSASQGLSWGIRLTLICTSEPRVSICDLDEEAAKGVELQDVFSKCTNLLDLATSNSLGQGGHTATTSQHEITSPVDMPLPPCDEVMFAPRHRGYSLTATTPGRLPRPGCLQPFSN
ncbi:hypothetical protein K469DRAFT_40096 [Zopfia rhizophila CBS 207.26]|uniref:Uncharacterized protein n=1 Tax=Zopfia rhizophila CBS 207.26 TaxID=1314779 RepID=A0A6A6ECG3_9PEZI|nr:hypothetical protein K469DRAFT_40096 [Zopfia rhizophila CBS 207.26]